MLLRVSPQAPSAWSPESPATFDAGQGGVRLYGGALRGTDRLRPGTIVRLPEGGGLAMVQCIFSKPRAEEEEAQDGSGPEVQVQVGGRSVAWTAGTRYPRKGLTLASVATKE